MADRTTIDEKLHDVARLIQAGQSEAAEPICVSLVQSSPREAWAWFYLGLIRLGRSQPQDAEPAFKQAVDLCPTEPLFWAHLGIAVRLEARAAEAEGYCRRATMLDRTNGVHWVNLGGTLLDQQRFQEAAQAYREALTCNGNDALAWSFLGAAEQSMEQLDSAQQAYERSLEILPNNVDALTKYASLLCIRREWQRALAALQKALDLNPQSVSSWMVLGITCEAVGDMGQAEAAYRWAVQIAPQFLPARYSLATVLVARFALTEAEALIREILMLQPHFADAYNLQAAIHWCTGEPELALGLFRRSVSVRPNAFNQSKVLQCMHYAGAEPEQLLEEHRKWDSTYARPLIPQVLPKPRRRADDSIRIGFVSSHFGRHPISFLALPGLEALDKSRCAVVCYADQPNEDEYANRFKAIADMWRTTGALADAEFAEQIRRDEIDILVDLMGHTNRRLLIFARKPATVQVTWLGYVGTTGLSAMDFLLADRFHVKPGEESWHTEQVLRLPDGYCCYGPPADAPNVCPLPAVETRRVTFGCFNNPAKLSAGILDAWASILQQVPESRLMLKYSGLNQPEVQRRIREHFQKRSVAGDRIVLGSSPHHELLASYGQVDIALDTQPYSGGLTTCEALWMGVPVITVPGKTFAGRHSVSHLTNAGYPQFIAADQAGYIELAVHWANHLGDLAAIRREMRENVRRSPLCDAPQFAHDFVAVLRQAWQDRVADSGSRSTSEG